MRFDDAAPLEDVKKGKEKHEDEISEKRRKTTVDWAQNKQEKMSFIECHIPKILSELHSCRL